MSKHNILVLTSAELANPMRGTPIRICKFVEQMSSDNIDVTLVARTADVSRKYKFITAPTGSVWYRFRVLIEIIQSHSIEWVFTPTSTDIKMVLMLKLFTRVHIAIDIHGVDNEEEYYFGNIGFSSKVYRGARMRFYLLFFDKIFVVSTKMREYYHLSNKKVSVVYGGVSLEEFPLIAKYREQNQTPFEIIYMGNARSYQGLELLLDAAETLRKSNHALSLRLIISGDIAEVKNMLSKRELLDITIIHANVEHSEIHQLLASADALIIPRPTLIMTEYAYPSKLSECLATGIPVVTTNVGPVSEFLENGRHCIIVDSPTSNSLASGIESLYLMSAEERKAIGMAGRKLAEDKLQWNILGKTIRGSFE